MCYLRLFYQQCFPYHIVDEFLKNFPILAYMQAHIKKLDKVYEKI